jgi:hypothetical protein
MTENDFHCQAFRIILGEFANAVGEDQPVTLEAASRVAFSATREITSLIRQFLQTDDTDPPPHHDGEPSSRDE